jgi:hypothetical protein
MGSSYVIDDGSSIIDHLIDRLVTDHLLIELS